MSDFIYVAILLILVLERQSQVRRLSKRIEELEKDEGKV